MTVSPTSFLMILIVLRNTGYTGWVFRRMSLDLGLPDFLLMVRLGLCVPFGENHTSIVHSHHIISTLYGINMIYH